MKLDANRGKSAAIDSGAAIAGAVAAHALTSFVAEKLTSTNPMTKFVPLGVVVACIGVQALGVVPKGSDAIASALLGATVVSGMSAIRTLSGANESTSPGDLTGLAKLVDQYVPSLSGLGDAPMYDYNYNEQAMLMQSGNNLRQLGSGNAWATAPAMPVNKPLELRAVA